MLFATKCENSSQKFLFVDSRRGFKVFATSPTFECVLIYLSFLVEANLYSKDFPQADELGMASMGYFSYFDIFYRIHRFKLEL